MMNEEQARKALQDGYTLTHPYFCDDEWVKQDGFMYIFEDDIMCPIEEFWHFRKDLPPKWKIKE